MVAPRNEEVITYEGTGYTLKEKILKGPESQLDLSQSLGEFIIAKMKMHSANIAQIHTVTGESHTYEQLLINSLKVAQELKNHGIGQGDVVSICTTNTPASVFALMGSIFAGAAVNPFDPCLNKHDVKHLVNITRPKLLFVEQNVSELFEEVIQDLELNTKIVIFDPDHSKNQHICFRQFLEAEFESFEISKCENPKDQIAFLMSSSGTTGLPKVVSLTHANLIFQLKQNDKPFPPFLTILNMSSLFWISGVMVTLGGISAGIIRLLTPPFDPEFTLQTIEKYKAFWIILGVTYFARMVTCENIDKYNLSSVRMITIGGGKASKQHLQIGKEKFANVQLHPAYGLTETTGATLQLNDAKPNSIGYLIPGVEAKIVDVETGKTLGPNQSGELQLRGPLVFKGYYRNPKATAETLDEAGWIHTGDKVYYDEDQCFFIEGRMKEMFKCRGWQIAPLELENTLMNHPDIHEAAVVGVPHDIDVARARAFIVKRQHSQITEKEIQDFMRQKLNPNKQITGGIVFLDALPTTPTGKVQKRTLNELVRMQSV